MFKVKISDREDTIYADEERSLLEQLKFNNYYIKSSCGGHASCTDCVIKVTDGKENLNEPTKEELKLLGNVFHITKERLACQCFVKGEITIDISNHDKETDENSLLSKNRRNVKTRVRKPEEVSKIIDERKELVRAKNESRDKNEESWHKHWEKQGIKAEKKLGGGKRPTKIKDVD